MLHQETVEANTFRLLKNLMQDAELSSFSLAGGTSLALLLGHRMSIDLDLFTPVPFNATDLEQHLIDKYDFKSSYLRGYTLKGMIGNVNIDCIRHDYPFIKDTIITEGIRLYSIEDVSAMKLSAIADNGTRLKDFIDIACLSTQCSLTDMLKAYEKKFSNSNSVRAIKGLSYYDDVNFNESILMINGSYRWDMIRERIYEMQSNPDKIFSSLPLEFS